MQVATDTMFSDQTEIGGVEWSHLRGDGSFHNYSKNPSFKRLSNADKTLFEEFKRLETQIDGSKPKRKQLNFNQATIDGKQYEIDFNV